MMSGMRHNLHNNETGTFCLEHQRPEDCPSPRGLVCRECQQRLQSAPPRGELRSFWESQPAAFTLGRVPCWVYTLVWDDFRIRSLHWSGQQGLSAVERSEFEDEWGAVEVRATGQVE